MKKGFTLVELLIVMSILGVLYLIVMPSFRALRDESLSVRARKEMETLQLALNSYYKNNGSYPFAAGGTTPSISGYGLAVLTTASPQIISKLPENPFFLQSETLATGKGAYGYYTTYFGKAVSVTYLTPANSVYYVLTRGPDRQASSVTANTTAVSVTGGDDYVISNVPVVKQ